MFAFSVVTVNDEHTKPTIGSKESVGVKFREGKKATDQERGSQV